MALMETAVTAPIRMSHSASLTAAARIDSHATRASLTTFLTMGIIVATQTITTGLLMPTIQASVFKAKCLALMDQVARTGETIVVTKNGKPVAELRPHRPPRAKSLIGLHKGQIQIVGDIVEPIGSRLWEVAK